MSKERVTLTVTCNADGSQKLLLIVIGKSLKSHCLKMLQNCKQNIKLTNIGLILSIVFT